MKKLKLIAILISALLVIGCSEEQKLVNTTWRGNDNSGNRYELTFTSKYDCTMSLHDEDGSLEGKSKCSYSYNHPTIYIYPKDDLAKLECHVIDEYTMDVFVRHPNEFLVTLKKR